MFHIPLQSLRNSLPQACLAKQARSEEALTQQQVEDQWAKEHELFRHPSSGLVAGSADVFKPTVCAKLGTCICSRVDKAKLSMYHNLKTYIKSCHPGTQKKPSVELKQFTQALFVLEISTVHSNTLYDAALHSPILALDESPGPVLYLHVGFVNYSTWEMTCARLFYGNYNAINGFLMLQAGDSLEQHSVEVRTSLEFLKQYCDIDVQYFLRLLRIVDDRKVEYSQDVMLPRCVDVVLPKGPHGISHCFWRGASIEFAPRISKHRKPKAASNRGGATRSQSRPSVGGGGDNFQRG